MKETINKIKNKILSYHPSKKTCILFFVIPILICVIKNLKLDNDIWFLLNHGKYVLSNGIPTIEPFTIHSNMSFVMQQWLTASIFWSIYNYLGPWGLFILVQIINIIIIYFLYKLCMLISDNKFRLSTIITIIITSILNYSFITTRPQIFTYLNIILTLYILELYTRKDNKKALLFLPIISILQVNMHSSMWIMPFIFILPFIVDNIFCKIKKQKTFNLKYLIIIIIVMIACGFINPYGIRAMSYIFTSLNPYIDAYIGEMKPLVFRIDFLSLAFYILIFLTVSCYIIYKKGKLEVKYFLLTFGTLLLGLKSIKGFSYFLIGGIYPLAYYLKDLFKKYKSDDIISDKNENIYYILICIVLFASIFSTTINMKHNFNNKLEKAANYLLDNYDSKDIKLYVSYNDGGYTEYRGIKSYIDPRAEVFLKKNNKQKNIFDEYYKLQKGINNPDYFIRGYNFTHILVSKNDKVFKYLCKHESNYKLIYEEENYFIYAKDDIVIKS